MKVYDCFIFFDELDLLEMRFRILDEVVDYFVLVEATKTKSRESKELFFLKNKERFKKWKEKIIHIIVEDMPKKGKITFGNKWQLDSKLNLGRWKLETYQINQIKRGLKNAKNNDIILVSDVDEIPHPNEFEKMKKLLDENLIIGFSQNFYYYYLNGFKYAGWIGTKACKYENFKKNFANSAARVRRMRGWKNRIKRIFGKKEPIIRNGGWHFSYLSSPESILHKMKFLCGQEFVKRQVQTVDKIKERIEKGEDLYGRKLESINYVPIDSTFPEEIQKNQKRYAKFIKEA